MGSMTVRGGPESIESHGPHSTAAILYTLAQATTMSSLIQTKTPYGLANLPQKDALTKAFVGQPLEALRTPAMVIDRTLFQQNCVRSACSHSVS
jgi:hypothetical protein